MMTALYRRYRPETFEEVIGQDHVTKALQAALANGRVNHAYLFSGPRGCGKTTSARILARCLNCEKGPAPTPCGKCPSCQDLATGGGGSMDVVEIDAASHNGVEDARELRERAVYAPVRDRFKIFILDEAHMVTSNGFNALLKLVEEPPAHIKFIFATTDPDKVISTIRSRTHHYPFRLVAPETLREYLAQLCHKEGVTVQDGVFSLVLRAGGGSVRDSLSVLDQLIAGEIEPVLHYDRAVALLGYTDWSLLSALVDALISGSGEQAYKVVDKLIQTGNDPRRFVEDLLQYFRDLVVMKLAGDESLLGELPESELNTMRTQVRQLRPRLLTLAAQTVSDGLDSMTGASSPRLALELLVAQLLVAVLGEEHDLSSSPVSVGETVSVPDELPVKQVLPKSVKEPVTVTDSHCDEDNKKADSSAVVEHISHYDPAVSSGGVISEISRQNTTADTANTPNLDVSKPDQDTTNYAGDMQVDEPWEFERVPWDISGENPNSSESESVTATPRALPSSDNSVSREDFEVNPETARPPKEVMSNQSLSPEPENADSSTSLNDGDFSEIRAHWTQIMAELKRNHSASENLISNYAQLQALRGDILEIAFRNSKMVNAFTERHTTALAEVIQNLLNITVQVRGVEAGFGAAHEQYDSPVTLPSTTETDLASAGSLETLTQVPPSSAVAPAQAEPERPVSTPAVKTFTHHSLQHRLSLQADSPTPDKPGIEMARSILGGTIKYPKEKR